MRYLVELTIKGEELCNRWVDKIAKGEDYPAWVEILLLLQETDVYSKSNQIQDIYDALEREYAAFTGENPPFTIGDVTKCLKNRWIITIPEKVRITVRLTAKHYKRLLDVIESGFAENVSDAIRWIIERGE